MNMTAMHTINNGKTDKIARYGWVVKDKPGEFRLINKIALLIPEEYQRELIQSKVKEITSAWSWFGCGSIIVAQRDGAYWVVDGQHRVLAAMRRSDIDELPCMVFQSANLVDEAKAFITVNTGRKAVTAIDKLKVLAVAEDTDAAFVVSTIERLGLRITKTAFKPMDIKCISVCQKLAKANPSRFVDALTLAAELSAKDGVPIGERVLSGLFYFDAHIEHGLSNARLRKRIKYIGSQTLLEAANRASAYFAVGGTKVWADGMLLVVNKGLRNQFSFLVD